MRLSFDPSSESQITAVAENALMSQLATLADGIFFACHISLWARVWTLASSCVDRSYEL